MADLEIGGKIYTTDRVTCFRNDEGNYHASIDNYYHAVGVTPERAIERLRHFVYREAPEVFAECRDLLDGYFDANRVSG